MGRAKDQRIKKLKKVRIWPSIVGLFFILLIFAMILVVVVASSSMDIVLRKVSQSSNQSIKIANLYESYDDESAQEIHEVVVNYLQLEPKIEAVSVMTADGAMLWSSSGIYPNTENAEEFDLQQEIGREDLRIIIEEDEQQIFSFEDGGFVVTEDIFSKIKYRNMLDARNLFRENENSSVLHVKLWYAIPVNDLIVYVLNDVHVYSNDLLLPLISIMLVGFIIAVFTIYYLISFISVIVSMRRTSKIIYTDMVTGGDNWLSFVKKGTALLKKNRAGKYRYAMLHLRLRKYRSFCTCFGVREGEALLEKFYYALKQKLNKKEALAHHENAEFGLLLTYTDEQQLHMRIFELEQALHAVMPNMKFYFGVGVYRVEAGEKDVELLYNNAQLACEMLGEDAENQIAFFDVEMNRQKLWERKVEDDMERALVNREFQVYLQPKISTSEEKLAGAEALVRWIHPTEGFIPPNKFIPIFEQNGFILKLDDYMLESIARQQAEWIAQGRKIVPISVNVSRVHFTRTDLAEHITAIVDRYNVPHNVIELELTESAFFDDKKVLLDTVKKLRDAGFIISMDDFGAGYSSLNSLKELQLDVLKIDADFFRGTDSEERGMLIVSEVIDLAKKLNMKIVAEGIESREQVDFLAGQECDLIQGYFFAKPMAIDEFVAKYTENEMA